jgi:hypothetical protein
MIGSVEHPLFQRKDNKRFSHPEKKISVGLSLLLQKIGHHTHSLFLLESRYIGDVLQAV